MRLLLPLLAGLLLSVSALRADPLVPIPYFDPSVHTAGTQVILMDPAERQNEIFNGVRFQLSFDLKSTGFTSPSFFQLYWDGGVLFNLTDQSAFDYKTFTFTGLSPSLDFNFMAFQSNGPFAFKNISLQQIAGAPVPENLPASWLAFLMAGTFLLTRRFRSQA